MRIDRLSVKNFKGFAEQTFEFNPEFNLLIGENGSGKSSALQAVSLALTQILEILTNSVQGNSSASQIRHVRQGGNANRFEPQFPFTLDWVGKIEDQTISCSANVSSESTMVAWSQSVLESWHKLRNQLGVIKVSAAIPLPLIAFYRANRSAPQGSPPAQWQSIMQAKPQRLDGYLNCLDATALSQSFLAWLAREQLISLQDGKPTKLFRVVERAVCNCLPGAESIAFVVRESQPVVRLADSRELLLSDLSDGQRSLLALAADLAIRAAQLNDHLGDDLLAQCPGVVLIDELDLHLHPRWQRHVVADLRRTFPKVQFIVTTHSPQIIGEVPPEQILALTLTGNKHINQSYGLDSNEVLENVMDAPSRNEQVDRDLSDINDLIEANELDAAKERISKLRELQSGPSEATVRAQALVDQIEMLADEMDEAQ